MTNLASILWCAAVQSAWMVYMLPPSPVNPITVLSGWASFYQSLRECRRLTSRLASGNSVPASSVVCTDTQLGELVRFIEDDRVLQPASSSAKRVICRGTSSRTALSASSRAANPAPWPQLGTDLSSRFLLTVIISSAAPAPGGFRSPSSPDPKFAIS